MAKNTSDKPIVRNLIIVCVLLIALFHFIWTRQLLYNVHNAVFSIVDGLLLGLFIKYGYDSYVQADDPNKEWKRKVLVAITVVLLLWTGGWAAGYNERIF